MVFVTGATGLVGRYLVDELLRSGEQVRALCRPRSDRNAVHAFLAKAGTIDANLEWVEGSMHDGMFLEESLVGCQRVYHCAALVSFHPKDAEVMLRINRDATGLLVNAMLHAGVEELVHVSSVAALGRKPGEPVHEDVPFEDGRDVSHYARSKFAAELEVWRGQEEGLKVLTVNPVIVLGQGDFSRSSSMLFTLVHRGLNWYPMGTNGFVAARDVARACSLLAHYGCWGERYVLCSENASYRQLMTWMAEALGVPAPRRPLKSWMMGTAWRLSALWEALTGRRAPISKESVENTNKDHRYATDKLERTLKAKGMDWVYEPIQTTIEATVPAVLEALGSVKR
jgi:nucleoside-diphosphate-sugar epimerase